MIARRTPRPVLATVLAAITVMAALLPPSHIHLAEHDDDHHHAAVEHAHWTSHHLAGSEVQDNDDEGRVLFVDHMARVPGSHAYVTRPPVAVIALLTLPIAATVTAEQRTSGNAPRDGPPRGLSQLRAPPISPAF